MSTIQYLGKKPSMISGKYIFEGHTREVSESQADQLMNDFPDDYRIVAVDEHNQGQTFVSNLDGSQQDAVKPVRKTRKSRK